MHQCDQFVKNNALKPVVDSALPAAINRLASELFPKCQITADNVRAGDLYGEPGTSFAMALRGERAGLWTDFATGEAGDIYTLIQARFGLSFGEAVKWLAGRCGILEASPMPAIVHRPDPDPRPAKSGEFLDLAQSIWDAAKPAQGTAADYYLRSRGVDLSFADPAWEVMRLVEHGKAPDGEMRPFLCFQLTDGTSPYTFCGIQRIFFDMPADSKKRIGDKKMLGSRLGSSTVIRFAPDDEVEAGLGIAEGPITALAIHAAGWRPIWSVLSAGKMAKFPILSGVEALTIFADHDAEKNGRRAGIEAAEDCGQRWVREGREVQIFKPVMEGTDLADALFGGTV